MRARADRAGRGIGEADGHARARAAQLSTAGRAVRDAHRGLVGAQAAQRPDDGIVVRLCDTPLGLNPRLAGLKHLNRLEQVLASAEWNDPAIAEGLMSSVDGRIICATAANVFLVRDGVLVTPATRDCGVAGVMRGVVLAAARELAITTEVTDVRAEDLERADEVFLTNAITGVRPVGEILGVRRYAAPGEVTRALLDWTARAGE